ncbi:MAG: hypothetical protein Q4G29_02565 [Pseudoscardovia radai]|nr:hypothetical protein [Pseudoscardovia radai]
MAVHPHPALRTALSATLVIPLVFSAAACGGSSNASGSSSDSSSSGSGSSWISTVDWSAHPATDTDLSLYGAVNAPIAISDLLAHTSSVNIATDGDTITDPSQLTTSDAQLSSNTTYDTMTFDSTLGSLSMTVGFSFYQDETSTVANAFNDGWWKISLDSTSSSTIDSLINVEPTTEDEAGVRDEGSVRLNAIIRQYGAPSSIWYFDSQFDLAKASEGGAYDLVWERDGYAFDVVVQDIVSDGSTVADAAGFGYYPANAWNREKEQLQSGLTDSQGGNLVFKDFQDVASQL